MLSNLDEPNTIGPAMAIALLTTLYGALFANLFALPIADKLKTRTQQEIINKSLIIEGVLSIQKGENPQLISEYPEVFMPSNNRGKPANSADDSGNRVKIEFKGEQIILRFPENVTFKSGSDMLSAEASSVLQHIARILKDFRGKILVSCHSDNQKISNERFRSNWELSAARAISVVTELLANGNLDTRRIVASGHADTIPLFPIIARKTGQKTDEWRFIQPRLNRRC